MTPQHKQLHNPELNNICQCCHRKKDLRLGYCWDCIEMESVMVDGTDMYDNKIGNSMDRLKYIIDRIKKLKS